MGSFQYMTCETCGKTTLAEYKSQFMCRKCELVKNAKPRYRFTLSIKVKTGALDVTVWGEKLLGMEPIEFADTYGIDGPFPIEKFEAALTDIVIRMRIRSTNFTNANFVEKVLICLEYFTRASDSNLDVYTSIKIRGVLVPQNLPVNLSSDDHDFYTDG